jgi:hypothetical protein
MNMPGQSEISRRRPLAIVTMTPMKKLRLILSATGA